MSSNVQNGGDHVTGNTTADNNNQHNPDKEQRQ